jgi:hypothetical protein
MRQGADRAPLRERADDLYETPACAVHALLRVEALPREIWEPCAGRGAISRILTASGRDVIAQDLVAYAGHDSGIATGIDFLMEWARPFGASCCICTNPPFKLADEFIRHGLKLGCDVVVLLRLMALEGERRSDLIDDHLVRVWAGIERLPQMHREGWEGNRQSNSGAPFAWFVFSPTPKGDAPTAFRRISWRNGGAA